MGNVEKRKQRHNHAMADTPGLSRTVLTDIQNSCFGVDHLQIEEIMLDWTPAEARAYFESRGNIRPDAEMVRLRLWVKEQDVGTLT